MKNMERIDQLINGERYGCAKDKHNRTARHLVENEKNCADTCRSDEIMSISQQGTIYGLGKR